MVERVAIVIERADAALGGAERSMLEVTQALSALGVQVDLLVAKGVAPPPSGVNHGPQPGAAGLHVHILCPDYPNERVPLPVFASALRRHLSKVRYDIVHSVLPLEFADVYQPRGGTYAESIRRNAASYPTPIIRRWKRITAFTNLRRAELLRAERRLCRGSDGPVIAALSHYVADQLKEYYATDPNRIVLTLNGITLDPSIDSEAADRVRRQFVDHFGNNGIDKPVLYLFAAHNFRLKGLHPLIRAMQMACTTRTERPIGLVVAGADKNRGYRRLARRLGVENHILFLGPVGRIRDILPAVDVGILPTFYDPSSRFILEALAAGKPVITTRFNGATDLFTPGRHGEVIDSPDNIPALADAIIHFTSAVNIEQASRAIREDDLRAKVSIHRVARETLDLYHSILKLHRRSPHNPYGCGNPVGGKRMPAPKVEDMRCTACGSTNAVELIRLKDGAYRQCADCGSIFASPMPAALEQINEESFTNRLDRYTAKVHTQDRHYREKLRRFARYRRTGRLLEIGCNAGAALDVARQMGWSVTGVEPCTSAASFAREQLGLDVFTGTVEAAAFPDDCFDVVFTNAVLEHLRDPLSVLRECRRILRPGGVFYADTVNWDSLTRRLLGARWEYLDLRGHVHLYTPQNVRSLCDRAGLEHVRTWTTGMRVHPRSAEGFDARWCWRLLKGPLRFVARWTNTGDHLKFLARKPAG